MNYPEQQSGVVVPPVVDEPQTLTLQEALTVMMCGQILGKRRYNALKIAAGDVIDAAAAPIVAKWRVED